MNNDAKVEINFVNTEKDNVEEKLKNADSILIPGGFGERGVESVRLARRRAAGNRRTRMFDGLIKASLKQKEGK